VGFCAIYKHFSGFGFFLHLKHCPRPPTCPLAQTVGRFLAQSNLKEIKVVKKSIKSVFLIFIVLTVLLSGCASTSTPVPPTYTPSPIPPTLTPEPTATATAIPSPTSLPGEVVLPVNTLGKNNPWLSLDKTVTPIVNYVGFNTVKSPFNNALVRQAFAYSVDREAIAEKAKSFGIKNVTPATTLTPPQTLGRDLYNVVGTNYDPQKAKELLAQAGYTDSSKFPSVVFLVNYNGGGAVPGARANMANAIAKMWQDNLGVKVEVQAIPSFKEYTSRLATNPPDLFWMGWMADYNDPANFFDDIFGTGGLYHGENNIGHFSNPDLTDLMNRATKSQDPAERQAIYIEAERLVCETEAAVIPLFHSTNSQ
jgi:ABC-type transport system substrate-binding protein